MNGTEHAVCISNYLYMIRWSTTSDISCSTNVPEAKRAHLQEHLVYVVGLSVAYQEVDYMEHSVGMAFYL